ncbi:MAG: DUF4349 domain-containing protein [Brevundimonas sp.]|uniref:DUF4349 domain-containing protein n=1 Tax=Brevundimonas sp. TaxID=1871086 RepID=UPI002719D6F4|nr:DUF4349 domain-containing protein [Brevundimonas sp.]MDO9077822.1 DUF4349 domain-containing protein [Brevundimonas sp.]MDP3079617.1 DUF4349 domain-containing protein [Brevundimonas sp.]MDZ4061866.1 DUF4349 domain-containing protein [Brevundimonas sp.]
MRKALMLASAGLIVLAGCSPASDKAEMAQAETVPAADAAAEAPSDATRVVAPRPAPLAPVAQIAYAYRYALSLPRDRGAEMMSRHELACVSAGTGYCQVISARADWTSREPGGRLELRGQPEWINRFRSGLALDAQDAGGRLDEAATNGEDVTRDIDTAATGAQTTASLAERIRQLQARSGGTMAQRLEIERQLAALQQQYDAQQIELRALNDRIQSARLTLDYRQGGVMAADSPTRPVARALGDAFGLSMGMLAILITAGSVLLPIVVIGGAVWWAVRRRKVASV